MEFREDQEVRIDNIQARGIIIKEDKVMLMFRRKNGKEYYVFPGGHMQVGEQPLETAIREVNEETTVVSQNWLPVFEFKYRFEKENEEIEYYFIAYWKSGTPTLSGEESRRSTELNYYEPMWVEIEKLKDINIVPLRAKEWVMNYIQNYRKDRD